MDRKKKALIALAVLVAVAAVSGVSILAATGFGSSDDPLITLSYLNGKVKRDILSELAVGVSDAQTALTQRFDTRLAELEEELDAALGSGSAAPAGAAEMFTVITLTEGQTVYCDAGTEFLLRSGAAKAAGGEGALVDSTAGAQVSAGTAIAANHMYIAAAQYGGLTASGASVTLLIRGGYTVS